MSLNNSENIRQNLPQQPQDNLLSDKAVPSEYLVEAAFSLHSSPLPPPEMIERYERVMSGAFDRILTMAEKDLQAKIEHDGEALTILGHNVRSGWFYAHCGQIFGFTSVILYFAALMVSICYNNTVVFGALLSAGAIAGLARLVRSFQSK
jgi:uncharacterized membrane protein